MDAPEKIYLNAPKIQPELDNTTWDTKAWKDCENIEYIRKDALTEWAENWKKLGMSDDFLYAMELLINHMNSM